MGRSLVVVLALSWALIPASVWAAGKKAPDVVVLDDEDPGAGEAAGAWLDARLMHVREGRPEIVRMPIVARSRGWGCACPDAFIGIDPLGNIFGLPWLDVDLLDGVRPLKTHSEEGEVVVAEGWFTGKTRKEDLRDDPEMAPEDGVYTLFEFVVVHSRTLRDGEKASLSLLLGAPDTCRSVKPIRDDRPWFVVVGSVPLRKPRHAERAEKLAAKLRAAGFDGVEVIDSRSAGLLWCCADVVVAGRFTTKKEAKDRAKAIERHHMKAYAKRAFKTELDPIPWPKCKSPKKPKPPATQSH